MTTTERRPASAQVTIRRRLMFDPVLVTRTRDGVRFNIAAARIELRADTAQQLARDIAAALEETPA